ncbi:2'-5'-oligoadenylate synthase 3-like [Haliotis rufescens]|uniref:2'-5'-oligoadenylate synthase 3-like n=1 Tax=Haliotis rufescens TaxID=6454 RepID=UPI00201F1721|nr:2'-5'-oligoadenylate synthase 3-like [Haliotis rufescens]
MLSTSMQCAPPVSGAQQLSIIQLRSISFTWSYSKHLVVNVTTELRQIVFTDVYTYTCRMKTLCYTCNRSFPDDSALYNHTLKACKTCMYCNFRFDDVEDIRKHMNDNHMKVSCSTCQRKFFHQGGLDTHTKNNHNPDGRKRGGGHRRRGMRSRPQQPSAKPSAMSPESNFVSEMEKCDYSVEKLLADMVQPDQSVLERYRETIESLKLFLQEKTKYSVSEVFKGGSFGKGTTIKVKSDIDIVVFLNDFTTVEKLKNDMENILQNLQHYIQHDEYLAAATENVELSDHAVQFCLKCDTGYIDVDLLPAVDVLPPESDKTSKEVWEQMEHETPDVKPYYSASFSPQQVDFVKRCPSRVKDLIRLVKHWKRIDDVKIRSYCIELMVIDLWRKWRKPERIDMKKRLRDIFQQLSSMTTTRITWPDEYDIRKFSKKTRGSCVMDPANPFMNTAPTAAQAKTVEEKARIVYHKLCAT